MQNTMATDIHRYIEIALLPIRENPEQSSPSASHYQDAYFENDVLRQAFPNMYSLCADILRVQSERNKSLVKRLQRYGEYFLGFQLEFKQVHKQSSFGLLLGVPALMAGTKLHFKQRYVVKGLLRICQMGVKL
jgi:hypothetical protein